MNDRSTRRGNNDSSSNASNGSTNSNEANGSSNSNGGGSNGSAARKRKKSRKKPKLDPVRYWGDATSLPVRDDYVLKVKDPTAVIRSLGKAPIPGKNSAPELYFEVLYARAAGLAQALAFAGGLNAKPTPDDPDVGDVG